MELASRKPYPSDVTNDEWAFVSPYPALMTEDARLAAAPLVVERSFAWMAKSRRLAQDYERLPTMVAALHFVAFACCCIAWFLCSLKVHNRF